MRKCKAGEFLGAFHSWEHDSLDSLINCAALYGIDKKEIRQFPTLVNIIYAFNVGNTYDKHFESHFYKYDSQHNNTSS